jgi:two-component system sensor histidine kinase KdpD
MSDSRHVQSADVPARPLEEEDRVVPRGHRSGLTYAGEWVLVVLAATLASATAVLAERWLGLQDVSMVFIVTVVLVAAKMRVVAAAAAAILCFLAYNYFFIDPRYTLAIGARQGVATVFLFLAAALVAGRLASRLREQVVALRAANARTTTLQVLGRQLAAAADAAQAVSAGRAALERATGAAVLILSGDDVRTSRLPQVLNQQDRAVAAWVLQHNQAAEPGTEEGAGTAWWFLPLAAGGKPAGVVGLRYPDDADLPGADQRGLIEAMIDDVAQALLRTRLVADLQEARLTGETERLRSALLSSVSHDLRSPLAAIIGAAGSLDTYGDAMNAEDRHSLLETVRIEGERLDRYIQNLLDMTRLGHGAMTLRRDWIGIDELLGSATTRLQRYDPMVRFDMRISPRLAPLWVHPALVEQALFNVLENAARFSPPASPITISAAEAEEGMRIEITDRGPGIPEDERARIFDMFFSVERGDRGRQGTGLGLAITRGMVGAHGGAVEALPGPGGIGTTVRILLPRQQPSP